MKLELTYRTMGLLIGAAATLTFCQPTIDDDADDGLANEEISSTASGLLKGFGGVNGDYNYCDGANLCLGGEGDCDSNTECTGGAICGKDNGAAFGMPKTWDVCVAPHCTNHLQDADETGADCGGADCGSCNGGASCTGTNGDLDFCLAGCQCGQGQGDCDYDSDCQSGLVCKRKIGASFGLSADTDVCVAAHCRNAKRDADETGKDCGGADCQACPAGGGLVGPVLDNSIAGWCDSGLVIKALRTVTLGSVVVNNQGIADTIRLRAADDTILQSFAVPNSSNTFVANVNWALAGGTTYHLTLDGCSNGRWTNYSSFPTSNADISVEGTWGSGALQLSYWFTFTNLVTF